MIGFCGSRFILSRSVSTYIWSLGLREQRMPNIEIVPVTTGRQRKQFLSLPWKLYADDPHWIPPLRQNQKELVGFSRHPFYSYARSQAFLAYRDGEPCGRVLVIINPAHNERYDEQLGFFGFFESIDEQDVANGLFDAAKAWLAEQDIHTLRGPCNPSLNYEVGSLIDGFDSSPRFMMTYNPAYHARLYENWGLGKVQDLYAFWGHVDMLESLDEKLAFIVQEATRRFDIKLRRMDTKRFDEDVRMFLDIYNKSLGGTWGFVPMSSGEVDHLAKSLKMLIAPEMTSVAEIDVKPVGAVFALLDYNSRIREMNGRLFPFGFLKLLVNKKSIKSIRLISANVLPEFQRWGVGLLLVSRLVPDVMSWGVQDCEFSWVLESNHLSRATLERGGAKLLKTYRIYEYPAPSAPEVGSS